MGCLKINSGIIINIENANGKSYFELVVDESAKIQKIEVERNDKTLA